MGGCNNVTLDAENNVNTNLRFLFGRKVSKDSLTLESKKIGESLYIVNIMYNI